MASGLLIIGVVALAFIAGELLYRRRSNATRFWGNLSQMFYAVFGIIVAVAMAFGGGVFLGLSFVFIILYYALFRTRFDDVSDANVRAKIQGK
ncbi:MAG: hypothetical protein ABEJ68_08415 [Halobacteriaceae archaeon]